MEESIEWDPLLRHQVERLELTRSKAKEGDSKLAIEVHALRLGEAGLVTNPFELFAGHGLEIQASSPAKWTFVVQLAGPGSYVATQQAVEHGGYGATRGPIEVGPEGGAELVNWSVEALKSFWD